MTEIKEWKQQLKSTFLFFIFVVLFLSSSWKCKLTQENKIITGENEIWFFHKNKPFLTQTNTYQDDLNKFKISLCLKPLIICSLSLSIRYFLKKVYEMLYFKVYFTTPPGFLSFTSQCVLDTWNMIEFRYFVSLFSQTKQYSSSVDLLKTILNQLITE